MNLEQYFLGQKKILEDFFGSEEVLKKLNPNHPALKRWYLCNKLLAQQGIIRWPEDQKYFSEIASMILDNSFWSEITGGNIQNLSLGNFSNYGDEVVRKKLLSEIIDENKFFDVMTEIAYAAWHISEGHDLTAYERNGYPDFKINLKDYPLPFVAECKYIHTDTKDSRFRKIIEKSGKQIKALNENCYGLTIIDISSKVREQDKIIDTLPPEVLRIGEVIEKSITSKNSAISGVLLIWNDYAMIGKPPTKSRFVFRRKGHLIRHKNPKFVLPEDCIIEKLGNTIKYSITWKPRKVAPNNT